MKTIHTEHAPAAIGPYSQAIVSGGFVFTSGQIPVDPKSGEIAGADVTACRWRWAGAVAGAGTVGRSRRAVFDMGMMVLAVGPAGSGRGVAVTRRSVSSAVLMGALCERARGRCDLDRRTSPAEVSSATHSTHVDAAGHHHAGSPVRLPGGQRTCVDSHAADYDRTFPRASNRSRGARSRGARPSDLLNSPRIRRAGVG